MAGNENSKNAINDFIDRNSNHRDLYPNLYRKVIVRTLMDENDSISVVAPSVVVDDNLYVYLDADKNLRYRRKYVEEDYTFPNSDDSLIQGIINKLSANPPQSLTDEEIQSILNTLKPSTPVNEYTEVTQVTSPLIEVDTPRLGPLQQLINSIDPRDIIHDIEEDFVKWQRFSITNLATDDDDLKSQYKKELEATLLRLYIQMTRTDMHRKHTTRKYEILYRTLQNYLLILELNDPNKVTLKYIAEHLKNDLDDPQLLQKATEKFNVQELGFLTLKSQQALKYINDTTFHDMLYDVKRALNYFNYLRVRFAFEDKASLQIADIITGEHFQFNPLGFDTAMATANLEEIGKITAHISYLGPALATAVSFLEICVYAHEGAWEGDPNESFFNQLPPELVEELVTNISWLTINATIVILNQHLGKDLMLGDVNHKFRVEELGFVLNTVGILIETMIQGNQYLNNRNKIAELKGLLKTAFTELSAAQVSNMDVANPRPQKNINQINAQIATLNTQIATLEAEQFQLSLTLAKSAITLISFTALCIAGPLALPVMQIVGPALLFTVNLIHMIVSESVRIDAMRVELNQLRSQLTGGLTLDLEDADLNRQIALLEIEYYKQILILVRDIIFKIVSEAISFVILSHLPMGSVLDALGVYSVLGAFAALGSAIEKLTDTIIESWAESKLEAVEAGNLNVLTSKGFFNTPNANPGINNDTTNPNPGITVRYDESEDEEGSLGDSPPNSKTL